MEPSEVERAVHAASSTASTLGLQVDGAVVVYNSDRVAVRLIPCDVLARVGPSAHQGGFEFEVEVARRLTDVGAPVGDLDPRVEPRVHMREGLAISLWTYYEPVAPSTIAPADYADALVRIHAGLRQIDLAAPHFTDRVAGAQEGVANRHATPDLVDADRELLANTLSRLSAAITSRGAPEQVLHGEPHAGNLLSTRRGPLFVDLGTCCRGPVEFDVAHAPEPVAEHYPGTNPDLIRDSRALMWAMVTSWRWLRDDQFPDRDHWRVEGLNQIRAALDHT